MSRLGSRRLQGLAIGMTGLPGLVQDPAEIAHRLRADLEVEVIAVAGDALTTHLGALGGQPGAVVAAGTGVISLGTDLDQIWHQVDGWGLFVGDDGSGAWVGQQGLRAAMRSFDGRPAGSPGLQERMLSQFGEPYALIERIHGSDSPAGEMAAFAPAVADVARSGDAVARSIWHEAGGRLAEAVVAAATDLPQRITWGGGLFAVGDLLHDPFRAQVLRRLPGADLLEPRGNALDGAVLLAHRAAASQVQERELYVKVFPAR